jgi:hypothetical protein
VSNSLCWCAVRCRRSHVKRRSKALLMRVMAPTFALDVLMARTDFAGSAPGAVQEPKYGSHCGSWVDFHYADSSFGYRGD